MATTALPGMSRIAGSASVCQVENGPPVKPEDDSRVCEGLCDIPQGTLHRSRDAIRARGLPLRCVPPAWARGFAALPTLHFFRPCPAFGRPRLFFWSLSDLRSSSPLARRGGGGRWVNALPVSLMGRLSRRPPRHFSSPAGRFGKACRRFPIGSGIAADEPPLSLSGGRVIVPHGPGRGDPAGERNSHGQARRTPPHADDAS